MLDCIKSAVEVRGLTNSAIAYELKRTGATVCAWFHGRYYIPVRVRNALCSVIGAQIDWDKYEAEFTAYQASRSARPDPAPAPPAPTPAPMPAAPAVTAPAPAPMPRSAPQRPATAPRRITATPPARQAQRPSVAAPAPAARKGGILGFLFDGSDDGMNFA